MLNFKFLYGTPKEEIRNIKKKVQNIKKKKNNRTIFYMDIHNAEAANE